MRTLRLNNPDSVKYKKVKACLALDPAGFAEQLSTPGFPKSSRRSGACRGNESSLGVGARAEWKNHIYFENVLFSYHDFWKLPMNICR